MSITAVGLFESPAVANEAVGALEASGFSRKGIRILGEPKDLPVNDVLSTPRTDFEVALERDLLSFGASANEAERYVQGVRRGGLLVFVTGAGENMNRAIELMNSRGAKSLDEFLGEDVAVGFTSGGVEAPAGFDSPQSGRVRQPGEGARLFVW